MTRPGAYIRKERTDPTGVTVRVVDLCHDESPHRPGSIVTQRDMLGAVVKQRTLRWGLVCAEHATLIAHEVLADAIAEAEDVTTWCDPCGQVRQHGKEARVEDVASDETRAVRRGDGDALPLLVDLMREAGHHDAEACIRLADQAEACLPPGPHKSRSDIATARAAAIDADWRRAHAAAWGATCGLTWAFPPDPAVCPPVPQGTPFPRDPITCVCGVTVRVDQRFCHECGHPLERTER